MKLAKEQRTKALLRLIDDPNPIVFRAVKEAMQKIGPSVLPLLITSVSTYTKDLTRQRVLEIIRNLQCADTYAKLIDWVEDGADDLLYGAYLVARYQYPDLKYTAINDKVNNLARELRKLVKDATSPVERIRVFNNLFYEVCGFHRNFADLVSVRNNCINDVLDLHSGNHISLCIMYCILCQRMGLPVVCVSMSRAMALCYLDDMAMHDDFDESDVMFFINPGNCGAIFGVEEALENVAATAAKPFTPCSNALVIENLIKTLMSSYEHMADAERVSELRTYVNMMSSVINK